MRLLLSGHLVLAALLVIGVFVCATWSSPTSLWQWFRIRREPRHLTLSHVNRRGATSSVSQSFGARGSWRPSTDAALKRNAASLSDSDAAVLRCFVSVDTDWDEVVALPLAGGERIGNCVLRRHFTTFLKVLILQACDNDVLAYLLPTHVSV